MTNISNNAFVKPEWLRVKAPQVERIGNTANLLRDLNLNTVLKDARARIIDLPGSNNNKSLDPVTIPDRALPGSKAKDQGSKQPGGLPKKNYALPGTSKIQDHNGPQNKKTALARDPNEIINGSDPARDPNE